MEWKNRIKEARLRAGMCQETFSAVIGSNQPTLSRWERGRTVPSVSKQADVMRRLDELDPHLKTLTAMKGNVAGSSERVALTMPMSDDWSTASPSAYRCMGLPRGHRGAVVKYSRHLEILRGKPDEFRQSMRGDPRLYKIESAVHIQTLDGVDWFIRTLNHSMVFGDESPRLLMTILSKEPYNGQTARIAYFRHLCDPLVYEIE